MILISARSVRFGQVINSASLRDCCIGVHHAIFEGPRVSEHASTKQALPPKGSGPAIAGPAASQVCCWFLAVE
jgi:hypothetical protein